MVTFSLADGPARIFFNDGEMVHAECGSLAGTEAVAKIVGNQTGKFNFVPKLPPDAAGMAPLGNFMGILMNALREMDEAGPAGE